MNHFSLHDALVPSWLQILEAVDGLIGKAEAQCVERKLDPATLIDARLAPDMYPLGYQLKSVLTHSIGAVAAVRQGAFVPNRQPWHNSFAGFRDDISSAMARLAGIDRAEMDGYMGQDLRFEAGTYKADFVAEDFLLSFAQPNFFFHATTAYGILRAHGAAIGKIDFLGRLRTRKSS